MIILFDLDGTLIDSTDAIVQSFHASMDEYNLEQPTDDEIKALIGYPLDIMFSNLNVAEDKVWDLVTLYKNNYRKIYKEKTTLLENAKEAIEKASKFATLGIVTTKTGEYSKHLMEHFGVMHHFDVLIGREHVQNPKPHAEPILKAIQELNMQTDNIWMIGDTKLDIISANNANINSIAVLSGYDTYENLKEFETIILNDTLEAIEYLQKNK